MPLEFTVLASGSSGNACLLRTAGFGLLLDAGLGPRKLAARLAAVGARWNQVRAVVLTHTHFDHWKDTTFRFLLRRRIPLYCHAEHHGVLGAYGSTFKTLLQASLVRGFEADAEFALAAGLHCRPISVRHDGGATFGFRFSASCDLFEEPCALGYVTDLGCWDTELARALADVDVLALEFNHDVSLEQSSGRSPALIARVLGEHGHLSNAQAASLVQEILRRSTPGRLRHLVQLHLSRECNHPALATEAARSALTGTTSVKVHTAHQNRPLRTLTVEPFRDRNDSSTLRAAQV
jgi:phosphoribosyl 1,2-cyclic phosphodiesterase